MVGNWTTGYTQAQLDDAQARYELRFPPDLIELYRERRLVDGYDWTTENQQIRKMLAWPYEMLLFGIEDGFWRPEFGDRPATAQERAAVLRAFLVSAPKLIPLYSHRFLPEQPHAVGNPVFSMYGFDTIYYGSDLENYFNREFERAELGPIRTHIPFWSNLVEEFDTSYAYRSD